MTGVGLHTGKKASLTFCPAPVGTGIHFVRADMPERPSLKVSAEAVSATAMATTLGGPVFTVSTIEHCLSALAALRIDNLIVELDGPEIPIIDGSAKPYLEAMQAVGFYEQDTPRNYFYITEPVYFENGDKKVSVHPYNGLKVTYIIDFPHPKIGRQELGLEINEITFAREIAPARTFGFLKDVTFLKEKGLALGGSLENAIILDDNGIMNPEGLRFPDEFVRHKILDALGDLVTLGYPLMGHLILYKAGHDLMNKFVKHLVASSGSYRLLELGADNGGGGAFS